MALKYRGQNKEMSDDERYRETNTYIYAHNASYTFTHNSTIIYSFTPSSTGVKRKPPHPLPPFHCREAHTATAVVAAAGVPVERAVTPSEYRRRQATVQIKPHISSPSVKKLCMGCLRTHFFSASSLKDTGSLH